MRWSVWTWEEKGYQSRPSTWMVWGVGGVEGLATPWGSSRRAWSLGPCSSSPFMNEARCWERCCQTVRVTVADWCVKCSASCEGWTRVLPQKKALFVVVYELLNNEKWTYVEGTRTSVVVSWSGHGLDGRELVVRFPEGESCFSSSECPDLVPSVLVVLSPGLRRPAREVWYVIICYILLTAIGLTPGGSSTVHVYTQTIHRTTQWNRMPRTEHS